MIDLKLDLDGISEDDVTLLKEKQDYGVYALACDDACDDGSNQSCGANCDDACDDACLQEEIPSG